MLNRLNTTHVGFAGLVIGGGSIVASIGAFFKLLSDPNYLSALFTALLDWRQGRLTSIDVQTYAQLAGVCIAIVGAIVTALLLSYFGRPATVPAVTNASTAAQAVTAPPAGKDPA